MRKEHCRLCSAFDLPEVELHHLEGYRGSKPVRNGNEASFHKQLDIYGELMDSIYLSNKYGKPISYDQWVAVRDIVDFICGVWREKGHVHLGSPR